MDDLILLPDFSIPRDKVRELVAASHISGKELCIYFVIAGQLGLTDTRRLAEQFLYAAYIGESIAGACSEFRCEAPSSIWAHESVEFHLVPRDVDTFMEQLWNSITALKSEELLAQSGHDEEWNSEWVNECWGAGWDLLDSPEEAPHTVSLIEHAQEMLREAGYDEEE